MLSGQEKYVLSRTSTLVYEGCLRLLIWDGVRKMVKLSTDYVHSIFVKIFGKNTLKSGSKRYSRNMLRRKKSGDLKRGWI
jgi:hypothetical protein